MHVSYPPIIDYYTQSEINFLITTTSGDIIDQIPPSFENSIGPVTGSGIFSGFTGTLINHNVDTLQHFTGITAAGGQDFSSDDTARIGSVYIKMGTNQDIIYNTGGLTE